MSAKVENIVEDLQIQVSGDHYLVTGRFHWQLPVEQNVAPHQISRDVDSMGQALKRQLYQALLQRVDEQLAAQWQLANSQWRKRGKRSYTFLTPFGRVSIDRQRLQNKGDGSWQIPSHKVWQTPHRQCIVADLREQTCDQMRNVSVRKTNAFLADRADCEQLLGNSTVLKILHHEGARLVGAQRERAEQTLRQHPQALTNGLATLPSPEEQPQTQTENAEPTEAHEMPLSVPTNQEEEVPEEEGEELSAEEEQQVWERAIGFLRLADAKVEEKSVSPEATQEPAKPTPRQVDADAVMVQVDEVKTKAQACCGGKENWTYTGYVQVEDRRYYLAEESAEQLWRVLGGLLCVLGVVSGSKRLVVIADGARWIGNWFADLTVSGKEMVLCWYHLAKKVYELLSGAGLGKEGRAKLEGEVLHALWHGDRSKAIWLLWGAREGARVPGKITELIRYLLRRKDQLPNYAARHEAGLMLTSNRVEKWNDWGVSDRCKRRGMSWTAKGVLSLAVLEEMRRNGELSDWRCEGELPAYQGGEADTSHDQAS